MPVQANFTIEKKAVCGNVFRLTCKADEPLPQIKAGQFAHIKVPNKNLRRPICVYRNTADTVEFIVAAVGEGTAALTALDVGARFNAVIPLGNGFPVVAGKKKVAVLGGGTGCAPLIKIAEDNKDLEVTALLGFPTAADAKIYNDDFQKCCKSVKICTDDGSLGYHGFPTDLLKETAPDVLYVCGALGMVKTAKAYCAEKGIAGFASLEQRMGCGVGACLVCSVEIERDGQRKLLRACADGPVFALEEIVL